MFKMSPHLTSTTLIDSAHPEVVAFAGAHGHGQSVRERAAALYLAVRDGFRYDPYRIDLSTQGMRASTVLALSLIHILHRQRPAARSWT